MVIMDEGLRVEGGWLREGKKTFFGEAGRMPGDDQDLPARLRCSSGVSSYEKGGFQLKCLAGVFLMNELTGLSPFSTSRLFSSINRQPWTIHPSVRPEGGLSAVLCSASIRW
jgi:hypothetical protein